MLAACAYLLFGHATEGYRAWAKAHLVYVAPCRQRDKGIGSSEGYYTPYNCSQHAGLLPAIVKLSADAKNLSTMLEGRHIRLLDCMFLWVRCVCLVMLFLSLVCLFFLPSVRQCLPVVGFLRSSLVAPGLPKKRRELGEDAQRRRLFLRGEELRDPGKKIEHNSKRNLIVILFQQIERIHRTPAYIHRSAANPGTQGKYAGIYLRCVARN